MRAPTLIMITLLATAGIAVAHSGVTNQKVMARMELMTGVKDAAGTLGKMARGRAAFDADLAAQAKQALIESASRTPAMFEAKEMDPKSEARDTIWQNWDRFVAAAGEMERAATALETDNLEVLQASFGRVGASCKSCHEAFRIEN